jgi:carbon storage regulator
MLVIGRKEGEEIVIGNPAAPMGTIKIVALRGNYVRVALDFPSDIPIHRAEVAREIIQEQEKSK